MESAIPNELSHEDEIKLIKSMIEKTKFDTAQDGGEHFIMWGWLVLASSAITYLLVYLGLPAWLPWAILMPIGALRSAVIGIRQRKSAKVVPYTEQALGSLWIACGISSFMVGFLLLPFGVIQLKSMLPVMAIIAGIGTFVTGGIIEWRLIRISGLTWWVAAIIMMFTHWHFHTLIFAITIIPGYLVPGYALRREYLNK